MAPVLRALLAASCTAASLRAAQAEGVPRRDGTPQGTRRPSGDRPVPDRRLGIGERTLLPTRLDISAQFGPRCVDERSIGVMGFWLLSGDRTVWVLSGGCSKLRENLVAQGSDLNDAPCFMTRLSHTDLGGVEPSSAEPGLSSVLATKRRTFPQCPVFRRRPPTESTALWAIAPPASSLPSNPRLRASIAVVA